MCPVNFTIIRHIPPPRSNLLKKEPQLLFLTDTSSHKPPLPFPKGDDNNGNIVYVNTSRVKPDMTVQPDTVQRAREERFRWDEENRLTALSQNGYLSHYWYDANGERDKRTVPVSQ